jgi:hypothetical protein
VGVWVLELGGAGAGAGSGGSHSVWIGGKWIGKLGWKCVGRLGQWELMSNSGGSGRSFILKGSHFSSFGVVIFFE